MLKIDALRVSIMWIDVSFLTLEQLCNGNSAEYNNQYFQDSAFNNIRN